MAGTVSNVEVCHFAYTGQFDKLKQIILSDKTLACKTDQDQRTALHWACSAGHSDIVEFLLDLGVEVNLQDDAIQLSEEEFYFLAALKHAHKFFTMERLQTELPDQNVVGGAKFVWHPG
ncbi:unnamed protein product [Pleuronectes platessa]|uniref:Proteasome 26S subunit, non-ATPase 10 n=1 Tax=Pleuronectes platessa TaxID=8262 RepID=A0A9N7UYZ9_PLEPL|nr:unnamed protein product [Pleuronectes platessa]